MKKSYRRATAKAVFAALCVFACVSPPNTGAGTGWNRGYGQSVSVASVPFSAQQKDAAAHGDIPVVSGEDELNALIQTRAAARYAEFAADAEASEALRMQSSEAAADRPDYAYNVAWQAGRLDAEYVCVLLDVQWYSGGAHGNGAVETLNWDLRRRRLVSPEAAVCRAGFDSLAALAERARSELSRRLNPGGDAARDEWIREGTAPRADNYRAFLLEDDGVAFYFQRYQVAAGVYGTQRVKISRETGISGG
ncbi:RsiV family protein [Treponema endosymbiont of Eucomonympha sp.]|uniref:RsiV family protein n=1 Tax=Treponema endosymbiont of Eucomonympha sp. TaxID=1580831 RepID=UPI000783A931|nr:RsiV family protein [Treponema endosymbiont of Eucomonympha sp.]